MKRKQPLKRYKAIPRKKATRKKRTPAQRLAEQDKHDEEFARTFGSEERVAWVRATPCPVRGCGAVPSENHHAKGGGTARRADAHWIVPLCHTHHAELHQHGANTFEVTHRIDLDTLAGITEIRWQVIHLLAAEIRRHDTTAQ